MNFPVASNICFAIQRKWTLKTCFFSRGKMSLHLGVSKNRGKKPKIKMDDLGGKPWKTHYFRKYPLECRGDFTSQENPLIFRPFKKGSHNCKTKVGSSRRPNPGPPNYRGSVQGSNIAQLARCYAYVTGFVGIDLQCLSSQIAQGMCTTEIVFFEMRMSTASFKPVELGNLQPFKTDLPQLLFGGVYGTTCLISSMYYNCLKSWLVNLPPPLTYPPQ